MCVNRRADCVDVSPVASVLVTDDQPCTVEEPPSLPSTACDGTVHRVQAPDQVFCTLTARICFDLFVEKHWKQFKSVSVLRLLLFNLINKIKQLLL